MSAYADLLGLVNTEQDIASKQTENQLRLVQMSKIQNQIDVDRQSRLIARAFEASKQNQQTNDAGLPLTSPNAFAPNAMNGPAGVATAGGSQGNGAPGGSPATGIDANPQVSAIKAQIASAAQDYQYHTQLAAALRAQGGNLELAQKYDDNARQARQDMAQGQLRLLQERKDTLRDVGALAGTASEDNYPQVRDQLDQMAPGWDSGLDVDFSPLNGGKSVWGPRTQAAMRTIADASMTRWQQMEAAHQFADEQLRAQSNDTQLKEIQSRDADRQSRDRARRDGIELRQDRESRLADQAAAKANAPGRPGKVTAPTVSEVKDIADNFSDEPGLQDLKPADRRLAARDFANYRNQVLAKNPDMDPAAAESEAMAFVKQRVQPAVQGTRTLANYLPFTDKYATQPQAARYQKGTGAANAPATTTNTEPLPLPATQDGLVSGRVYNTARGVARWNGTAFEKL